MIHKKQLSEMAKQIFRHKQGLHDPKIMHPYREWYIGLFVTVLIFAGSVYLSAYSYAKNKNVGDTQLVSESGEVVVYRETQVAAALKKISEREEMLASLLGKVIPSLPAIVESATSSVATSTAPVSEDVPNEVLIQGSADGASESVQSQAI